MLRSVYMIILMGLLTMLLAGCTHFGFSSSHGEEVSSEQEAGTQYHKADRSPGYRAKLSRKCINVNGHDVCGYDCKQSGGYVKCAEKADQRCVKNSMGQIACGYDCKATDYKVACGKYLYDNCVTNSAGDIRCGNNCYERDDGELVCGK